jgi:hypothetical protein
MTVDDFRQLLSKQPFTPFSVVMSSGERHTVPHPEMAFLTRTTLYIGMEPDKKGFPRWAKMCLLLHITTVESSENAGSQNQN